MEILQYSNSRLKVPKVMMCIFWHLYPCFHKANDTCTDERKLLRFSTDYMYRKNVICLRQCIDHLANITFNFLRLTTSWEKKIKCLD